MAPAPGCRSRRRGRCLTAALDGSLAGGTFRRDPNFGFEVPVAVAGVDAAMLDPRSTWADGRSDGRRNSWSACSPPISSSSRRMSTAPCWRRAAPQIPIAAECDGNTRWGLAQVLGPFLWPCTSYVNAHDVRGGRHGPGAIPLAFAELTPEEMAARAAAFRTQMGGDGARILGQAGAGQPDRGCVVMTAGSAPSGRQPAALDLRLHRRPFGQARDPSRRRGAAAASTRAAHRKSGCRPWRRWAPTRSSRSSRRRG